MRKKLIVLLVCVVLALLFTACGDTESGQTDTMPHLVLTAPFDTPQVVALPDYTVAGVAWDNTTITSVHVSLNGGAFETADGARSWSHPVTLAPGTNTIVAYCKDTDGNESERVGGTVVYDPQAVHITVVSPGLNVCTNFSPIVIYGDASVSNSTISLVEIRQGTGSFSPVLGTDLWGISNVDLNGLTNVFTVRATAADGRVNTSSFVVFYDFQGPLIDITSPHSPYTTSVDDGSEQTFPITVTYSDNFSGVSGFYIVVRTNEGGPVTGTQYFPATFSPQTIALGKADHARTYYITAVAVDAAGNSGNPSDTMTLVFTNLLAVSQPSVFFPGLIQSGDTYGYGGVTVGNTVIRTVTVSNTSTGPLYISNVSSTSTDFEINTAGMATTLPGRSKTTFTVAFHPGSLGGKSGEVRIATSSSSTPLFTINCTGQGVNLGEQWVDVTFILDSSNDPLTSHVPRLMGMMGNITNLGAITNAVTGGVFEHYGLSGSNNLMQSIGGNRYSITLRLRVPAGETLATIQYTYSLGTIGYPCDWNNMPDSATLQLPANLYTIPGLTVTNTLGDEFLATWSGNEVVITNYISAWRHKYDTTTTAQQTAMTISVTNMTPYGINAGNYNQLGILGDASWLHVSGDPMNFDVADGVPPSSFSAANNGTLVFNLTAPLGSKCRAENLIVITDPANHAAFGSSFGMENNDRDVIILPHDAPTGSFYRCFLGFF